MSHKVGGTIFLALALLAVPALGDGLVPFVPDIDGIFIQRSDDNTEIGNVRVVVEVSKVGFDQLREATGRQDFFVVGGGGGETIFRDDGRGVDEKDSDGLFSGILTIDEKELQDRANTDRATTGNRETTTIPDFTGRTKTGSKTAAVFDFDGFQAGELVPFSRAIATVGNSSADKPQQPNEFGQLFASHEKIDGLPADAITPGTNPFQERVLILRDLSVVQDPARTMNPCTGAGTPLGVWTFGHLMREMANQSVSGITPSDLAKRWLQHWGAVQPINSFNVPPRVAMNSLINDWQTASGLGGDLDLSIAPFRLLAILPRADLRHTMGSTGGYGGGGSSGKFIDAGELRFVFGVVLPPGYNTAPFALPVNLGGGCLGLRFSVIFEYGVPKCECEDVRDWAKAWSALATLPFPSATYNASVERLTQQVVLAGSNPVKPNGNALNQLRTNEISMGSPWELREFRLQTIPFDFLHETTTVDTPNNDTAAGPSFFNTVTVSNFILAGPAPVPLFFSGSNFLGGNPETPSPAFVWTGPLPLDPVNNAAHSNLRHGFSLGTCNGCHAGETGGTPFVHIEPATPTGLPAILSGFLTGISVNDPLYTGVGAPIVREFDDLENRELDIKALANTKCFHTTKINRVHVLTSLEELRVLPDDLFKDVSPQLLEERSSLALDDFLATLPSQPH